MRKLTIGLSVLFLLFLSCKKDLKSPGSSGEQTGLTNASEVQRPFKGVFYTSIDPDPANPPLVCAGDIPNFAIPTNLLLHGSATHLGEIIWQESTLHHVSCNLSVATMQLTINVSGQLKASNGDKVFYTGVDVINVAALLTGQANPTGSLTGAWTITGGTGRFQGATGSLSVNGSVDFATLTASFEANGTITY